MEDELIGRIGLAKPHNSLDLSSSSSATQRPNSRLSLAVRFSLCLSKSVGAAFHLTSCVFPPLMGWRVWVAVMDVTEVVVAVRVVDDSITAQLLEILLLLLLEVLLLVMMLLLLLLMILFTMLCLLRSLLPTVPVTVLR